MGMFFSRRQRVERVGDASYALSHLCWYFPEEVEAAARENAWFDDDSIGVTAPLLIGASTGLLNAFSSPLSQPSRSTLLSSRSAFEEDDEDVGREPHADDLTQCWSAGRVEGSTRTSSRAKRVLTPHSADANRPKSEEERRARTLDSKRRWARKNRAERVGRPIDDDGSVDEQDLEGWEEEEEDEDWDGEQGRGGSLPLAPVIGQGRGVIYPPSHANARDKDQGRGGRPSLRSSVSLSSYPVADPRHPLIHRDANSGPGQFEAYQQQQQYYNAPPPSLTRHLPPDSDNRSPYQLSRAGDLPLDPRLPEHPTPYYPPFQHLSHPPPEPMYFAPPASAPSLSTIAGRASIMTHERPYDSSLNYYAPYPPSFPLSLRSPVRLAESKEDAACVLLALKKGGSSPPTPMRAPREEEEEEEQVEVEGDSSLDSLESTDAYFAVAAQRRSLSPSSASTSAEETRGTKRAASESPPVRVRRAPVWTGEGSKFTSLVATPTPAMRVAMESSPAVGGEEEVVAEAEERRYEGRRRRGDSHSPSRQGKRRDDSVGLSSELGGFALSDRGKRTGRQMPPPHPTSSSSASSFNLSTPAGPSHPESFFSHPFSSSSAAPSSHDHYYTQFANLHQQPHGGRSGLSSPPNAYLFSSPAHPGVSKQLGLTAQPGPGVLYAAGETPRKERWRGERLPGIREWEGSRGD